MKNLLLNKLIKTCVILKNAKNEHLFRISLLLILVLSSITNLHAQKEDYNWIFGEFDDSRNHFNFDNETLSIDTLATDMTFYKTNSCFSDSNGTPLFYTNGIRIYDAQSHQLIENGDSLGFGWYWELQQNKNLPTQQGVLALQDLKYDNVYNLFHLWRDTLFTDSIFVGTTLAWDDTIIGCAQKSLMVTKIENDSGILKVISKNKIIMNDTLTHGGLTACRHANGRDWWIICQEAFTNCENVLLYTPDTIYFHHKNCGGFRNDFRQIGTGTFSPNGETYVYGTALEGLKIWSFDRCSGDLTYKEHISRDDLMSSTDPITNYLGFNAISPNSRYLYAGPSDSTFRFDLNYSDILATQTLVAWGHPDSSNIYGFDPLHIQEDGRIYAPAGNFKNYSVMNNPDECHSVVECDIDYFLPLPKKGSPSFGNFPNYRLGRLIGSPCDTLYNDTTGINELTELNVLEAYPNPAHTKIRIEYAGKFWEQVNNLHLKITNILGQEYYHKKLPEYSARQTIDLKNYASGIYFVYLVDNGKILGSIKFVKK